MNNITDDIIKKINDYLKYIEKQNIKFENYENIKNEYKKKYYYYKS